MRCDYTIDKLCEKYDTYTLRENRTGSLALIGDQQSPFFKAMKVKCGKLGITCVDKRKKDTRAIVRDINAVYWKDIPKLMDIDSIMYENHYYGTPAVSWATFIVLNEMQLVKGMHIVIIGRKHATKGLARVLCSRDATVTVAHSKTRNLQGLIEQADVVVCAAPYEVATMAAGKGPKRLLLDISGATNPAYLAACDYSRNIGKLTTSILAWRFTQTPLRTLRK